jgi:hypothetical protein
MKLFFREVYSFSASAEVVHKRYEAPGARLVLAAQSREPRRSVELYVFFFQFADRSIYKLLHSFQSPRLK